MFFWRENLIDNNWNTFVDNQKNSISNTVNQVNVQNNIHENVWEESVVVQQNPKIFKIKEIFEKRFSFKLTPERKHEIAERIIQNSNVDKMYWCQLVISCMLATLWLLMNSIPVVIWSMLVSPILTPIQTFAFAIINGKKHMYINSLKVLFLSILIAIPSSFLICYVIPFSGITEQVLLRATPTVVDGIVAILSWIIAFLFLSDDKLWESIVWIAIAVSLMPPLAAVWIGLHFMNWSVAQWSFLLFITNLVWILVVGILVFYLFWYRSTNKLWKKRTWVTIAMLIVFVWMIMVPLWKSMTQIAESQKIKSVITNVSDTYFQVLNDGIELNDLSFRDVWNNTLRIVTRLDVPSEFSFTNIHKEELTKRLSESLGKSVELDLDIVEISSVYIDDSDNEEKILLQDIHDFLQMNDVVLVDYKVLRDEYTFFFLNVYTDSEIDRFELFDRVDEKVKEVFLTWAKVILQWQDNLEKQEVELVEKSQAEIGLEKQFYGLFPKGELIVSHLNYLERVVDDEYEEYAQLVLEFKTPYSVYRTKQILSERKEVIKEYLWVDILMKVKFEEINLMEI